MKFKRVLYFLFAIITLIMISSVITSFAHNEDTQKSCNGHHSEVKDKAVAASCVKDGLTAGSHCSKCGKTISKQKIVPATGHDYKEEVKRYNRCDKSDMEIRTCKKCGLK